MYLYYVYLEKYISRNSLVTNTPNKEKETEQETEVQVIAEAEAEAEACLEQREAVACGSESWIVVLSYEFVVHLRKQLEDEFSLRRNNETSLKTCLYACARTSIRERNTFLEEREIKVSLKAFFV